MNKNKNEEIIKENFYKNNYAAKKLNNKIIDDSDNVFLRFNKYKTKNKIK